MNMVEELYKNDGHLHTTDLPQLVEELAIQDPSQPRPRRNSESRRQSSVTFRSQGRRRTTMGTIMAKLGNDDLATAHEDVQEAYSALQRVRTKASVRLTEKMEMIR